MWLFILFLWLAWSGCTSQAVIDRLQLDSTTLGSDLSPEAYSVSQRFDELVQQTRGRQFGDLVFAGNTNVHWILPELDALDLRLAAIDQNLSAAEYNARRSKVSELHEEFLIFSIELRTPFYAAWTQAQLIQYLGDNLIVVLENGTGGLYRPVREVFQEAERFHQKTLNSLQTDSRQLEVAVPVRVYFDKRTDTEPIVTDETKRLVMRLGLLEHPPFVVGFFDEKFFQGFGWKISR